MLTPDEIIEHAERYVEEWLTAQGYRCHATSAQRHGLRDVEAHAEGATSMLVHVLSHLSSGAVPELSLLEKDRVCSRALMLEADPWLAVVCLDGRGELVGEIQWSQLSS
ncbi:MAG: hypothetical protein LDL31_06125 [Prosthecobacter sp.]|nr:hypothetical protein [Prosthecobacter sp.]